MLNSFSGFVRLLTGSPYRWDGLVMRHNVRKDYGRRRGRGKSIYRGWGYNDSAYYVDLSKAERAGKTWQETQALRMKIWKERQKRRA